MGHRMSRSDNLGSYSTATSADFPVLSMKNWAGMHVHEKDERSLLTIGVMDCSICIRSNLAIHSGRWLGCEQTLNGSERMLTGIWRMGCMSYTKKNDLRFTYLREISDRTWLPGNWIWILIPRALNWKGDIFPVHRVAAARWCEAQSKETKKFHPQNLWSFVFPIQQMAAAPSVQNFPYPKDILSHLRSKREMRGCLIGVSIEILLILDKRKSVCNSLASNRQITRVLISAEWLLPFFWYCVTGWPVRSVGWATMINELEINWFAKCRCILWWRSH